jgi:flagellar protein FlgJ
MAPAQGEAGSWLDLSGLSQLKADAQGKDGGRDPATLKAVAQQFESLFLGMMLKSMRDANFDDSLFESDETKFYQDLFDKQISLNMSQGRGLGVADMLVRQLGQQLPGGPAGAAPLLAPSVNTAAPRAAAGAAPTLPVAATSTFEVPATPEVGSASQQQGVPWLGASPTEFVRQVLPHAQAAASALGVNPLALVAHAALETGWGKHVPAQAEGASSFNLFGVKATNWDGARTARDTVEFEGGLAVRKREAFRAYDSLAEGFSDYVKLLKGSPRYADALQAGTDPKQFAIELQRAGYATDPAYSQKIVAILHSDQMRDALGGLHAGALKPASDLPTP